jgi:hypothetical protein
MRQPPRRVRPGGVFATGAKTLLAHLRWMTMKHWDRILVALVGLGFLGLVLRLFLLNWPL